MWGADITRAGTKTSANAVVTSKTGKKALGEALDSAIAGAKASAKPKPKPKPRAEKSTSPEDEENKQLQKDIKMLLIRTSSIVSQTLQLISTYLFWLDIVMFDTFPCQGSGTRARRPEKWLSRWLAFGSRTRRRLYVSEVWVTLVHFAHEAMTAQLKEHHDMFRQIAERTVWWRQFCFHPCRQPCI